jgi:hypothetical protein
VCDLRRLRSPERFDLLEPCVPAREGPGAEEDALAGHVAALAKRVVERKANTRVWAGAWGAHRGIAHDLELLSATGAAAVLDSLQRRGGERSLDPRGARCADTEFFTRCPADSPEGKNIGVAQHRAAGAFHTPPGPSPWAPARLPRRVERALAGFLVPWAPDRPPGADDALVLLATEAAHSVPLGHVPAARARAAFEACEAAALEEERRLRTAAQAEAATLRGEKRHLEALMERLAAVVSTLTKRCAAFMDTGAPPAAPPGGDRLPRRQQQGTVSQSQNSNDTPSSLASLTAVLRAAERELSALDERLGSPAVTADEQAQLRAAMQRTGARIRKIAAARASLLGVKS